MSLPLVSAEVREAAILRVMSTGYIMTIRFESELYSTMLGEVPWQVQQALNVTLPTED